MMSRERYHDEIVGLYYVCLAVTSLYRIKSVGSATGNKEYNTLHYFLKTQEPIVCPVLGLKVINCDLWFNKLYLTLNINFIFYQLNLCKR